MQFILESQARAEIRMEKAEARADAMEKRFDRRLNGIATLIQQGMRRLVKIEDTLANVTHIQQQFARDQQELAKNLQELAREQRELAKSQRDTDRTLKAFIDSLRRPGNGGRGV